MLEIIERHLSNCDDGKSYQLIAKRDGKKVLSLKMSDFVDCPDHAYLNSDLSDIFLAIDFFKLGYESGKNGEEVSYESTNEEDDE